MAASLLESMFLAFGWLLLAILVDANEITELRMPGAEPILNDSYLCTSLPLDINTEHYLLGFKPFATMQKAHHMLLFGCDEPGSEEAIWDCGEMTNAGPSFERAPTCKSKPNILYAWGRDAPELRLPEGVGFKVGGESDIKYLVLQVHYMKKLGPDYSGVAIESTVEPMEKTASTLLMVTGGVLPPNKKETFETACIVDEDVEMHPFALRPHTHRHGVSVAAWVVREQPDGTDKWQLIGERDPLLPQMFQPVNDTSIVIRQGDMVASRCVMVNKENKAFAMGNTGEDEMCNYYMMYWVYGDNVLKDNTCYSPGAPEYHWASEAGLNNIPPAK
uniref:peptidylglycine monooxygenase n=1 Tax=Ascaris suum TaxID=6253 RepID=F1L4N0_ASCSU